MGGAAQRASITIDAPTDVVWSVFIDVEQWPTWTQSVTSVELLDGPMRVGASARIKQPRLPSVVWTVTELDPGRSWTWVASSPGARTTATHVLTAIATESGTGTLAEQSITQSGPLGRLAGQVWRKLTARYLTMEAQGLKQRTEHVSAGAQRTV